ncbi:MAG: hypothetical protein ACYCZU_07500 [Devosia sp.]
MTLNAPSQTVFIIAIIAVVGYFVVIPFVTTYAFWILVLAFVVLAGGVLMRGA